MGFLQEFFQNVFQAEEAPQAASYSGTSNLQLENHLKVDSYGSFQLTGAVRPGIDLTVEPRQGFRHDVYVDEESGSKIPVIMASASRECLFGVFVDLVQRLGNVVDVVLESSHDHSSAGHVDYYREHVDMPVLVSTLYDYEDLLLNDGCTGIAVLNPRTPQEIQFDEHKLLIMYGSPLEQFEFVLDKNSISCDEEIRFITEAEHVHSSTEEYQRQFEELKMLLGVERSE